MRKFQGRIINNMGKLHWCVIDNKEFEVFIDDREINYKFLL